MKARAGGAVLIIHVRVIPHSERPAFRVMYPKNDGEHIAIKNEIHIMTALIIPPLFAAVGYSLIYLLGGGGLFGAFVIFVIAKMLRK